MATFFKARKKLNIAHTSSEAGCQDFFKITCLLTSLRGGMDVMYKVWKIPKRVTCPVKDQLT